MAGMRFWKGFGMCFGGRVARTEGPRKRDATKQRLHVEEMHSEDDFELLEGVLEGGSQGLGDKENATPRTSITPRRNAIGGRFSMKKQEEVSTRMFTSSCFYIQKGCRHAFCRGEIAPKICQYAAAKKCQKLVGFC